MDVNLSLIYFLVGCNNLRRGWGGPGCVEGQGKREALHSIADLVFAARTQIPNSK